MISRRVASLVANEQDQSTQVDMPEEEVRHVIGHFYMTRNRC
jgi:hypothetical protein